MKAPETIKLFTVPPGSTVSHTGNWNFLITHPDGRTEFVTVIPSGGIAAEPTIDGHVPTATSGNPKLDWG